MDYTDFRITKETPDYLFAEVTETSGMWWWKRSERIRLFKPKDSCFWRIYPSGEFARNGIANDLYEAHQAREALKDAA